MSDTAPIKSATFFSDVIEEFRYGPLGLELVVKRGTRTQSFPSVFVPYGNLHFEPSSVMLSPSSNNGSTGPLALPLDRIEGFELRRITTSALPCWNLILRTDSDEIKGGLCLGVWRGPSDVAKEWVEHANREIGKGLRSQLRTKMFINPPGQVWG